MPALVVAMAPKPSAASTMALPASQAFGMMKPGIDVCIALKRAAACAARVMAVFLAGLGYLRRAGQCVQCIVFLYSIRFLDDAFGLRRAQNLFGYPPRERVFERSRAAASLAAGH